MSAYDERLLASAPAATRAEKQEGYNVDLLESSKPTSKSGTSSPTPVLASNADHAEAGRSKEALPTYTYHPTPWYRTKKWIAIFVILAIVVVGAVVGGAVGGSVGNKNKNSNNDASNGNTGQSGGANSGAGSGSGQAAGPNASSPAGSSSTPNASSPVSSPAATPSGNSGANGPDLLFGLPQPTAAVVGYGYAPNVGDS